MVAVHLTEDLAAVMESNGKSIDRVAHELIVLELYRQELISSGRAAEFLGMSRAEFIRYSGEKGIPFYRMAPEELEDEVRRLMDPVPVEQG